MEQINTADVVIAINLQQQHNMLSAHLAAPYGAQTNPYGLILYDNTISWQGFGGVTVIYTEAKITWLRHTVYSSMPVSQYMTDAQLLHHYFCYLTPANLLYDAALQVNRLPNKLINAINLN